jgi:hypothetical protein
MDLLSAIRKGAQLKKPPAAQHTLKRAQVAEAESAGGGLGAALAKSLANYRQFVQVRPPSSPPICFFFSFACKCVRQTKNPIPNPNSMPAPLQDEEQDIDEDDDDWD